MADFLDVNDAEARFHERILKFEADAERAIDLATSLQTDFAQRLMFASGAALGVLSTLIATDISWLSPNQFIGPVVAFILAISLSGIGLWTRTIALFGKVHHLLRVGEAFSWMKAAAEDQARRGVIGKEPPPKKPTIPDFPEWWFSSLDYLIVASGMAFITGLVWASLIIVTGSP